jgi:hypothetical protein
MIPFALDMPLEGIGLVRRHVERSNAWFRAWGFAVMKHRKLKSGCSNEGRP